MNNKVWTVGEYLLYLNSIILKYTELINAQNMN